MYFLLFLYLYPIYERCVATVTACCLLGRNSIAKREKEIKNEGVLAERRSELLLPRERWKNALDGSFSSRYVTFVRCLRAYCSTGSRKTRMAKDLFTHHASSRTFLQTAETKAINCWFNLFFFSLVEPDISGLQKVHVKIQFFISQTRINLHRNALIGS